MLVLDMRGMRCPWPAIRLARALRDGAAAVEMLADDPAAGRELAAVAATRGGRLEIVSKDRFRFKTDLDSNALFTPDA